MPVLEWLATWWATWRADRRHLMRVRLWLWHKDHRPGPCRCMERIEKLTPKEINMGPKPVERTPETLRAAMAVTCPSCRATAGNRCRKGTGSRAPHAARIKAGNGG